VYKDLNILVIIQMVLVVSYV